MTPWPWPIGTIVVCIKDDGWVHPENYSSLPVAGHYYTVRETIPDENAIRLCEIRGRIHEEYKVEYGFISERFRPAESDHNESLTVRQEQEAW